MNKYNHFISGGFRDGGRTFEVQDPATGRAGGWAARGTEAEIDQAVTAAREAFRENSWPDMDGRLRGNLLRKIAGTIRRHAEEIAALEIADAGKTAGDARAEVEI